MENIIVKFNKPVKFNGFNVQPGFYGLYVGKLAAVSSGWCCGCSVYIYTPRRGGRWYGRWVDYRDYGRLAAFAGYILRSEERDEAV